MKACIALILLLWPLQAFAQVELIIRLRTPVDDALVTELEDAASKQGTLSGRLEGVLSARSIFGDGSAAKTSGAPLPAYVLAYADSARLAQALDQWAADPAVAYAQYNHRYVLDRTDVLADDPMLDSLSHLRVIRAQEAWAVTMGRPDVRVGFVDTGVYFGHPDLAGQFWVNPGEDLNGNGRLDASDLNGIDDDGNGYVDDVIGYDFVDRIASVEAGDYRERDPDASEDDRPGGGRGHGTNVAGILAAAFGNGEGIAGVAPGVRLVPLRAFGADGLGEDDDVAAAIVYAAQNGVDVLNLSFGDVYESPLMRESIAYAVSQGTVVVASGGNTGGDRPHYPSDYPDVIAVAWLDAEGRGIAGRGSYGVSIDLGAPGSFVYTTLFPSSDQDSLGALYGRRSGSSMAAPMVSAAAALLRSAEPGLPPSAIREALLATAVDVDDPGWDHRTGAGRLDVAAALRRALPARVEIRSPRNNEALSAAHVAVMGTVMDPAFASYTVTYAPGDADARGDWRDVGGVGSRQVVDDTLAVWVIDDLPDGLYTLRLSVTLRTGKTVEDRRRVFVDRSAPVPVIHLLDDGLSGPYHAIVADVETDDLTEAQLFVQLNGRTFVAASDRRSRRHGLVWADESRQGGQAVVRLRVVNSAGLATEVVCEIALPANRSAADFLREVPLDVPHGYLLPSFTDFDEDGLQEVVLNRYQDGWVGDTLAIYEWDGTGLQPAWMAVANVIPRAVGDADGDGLVELLTQVSGATLVLEQARRGGYPDAVAYVDTAGLANPFGDAAAFGAALTDLDGDGRGEVLVHNTRSWRVLEWNGSTFAEAYRLENPTGVAPSEVEQNELQEPEVLIGDFDGDGLLNVLFGDSDGDWVLYEVTGDNEAHVTWTYETPRYNAGSRFAMGDFDGNGLANIVTFTHNWTQPTGNNEYEPPIGLYYLWEARGDALVLLDSLAVYGSLFRHGTLAALDLDDDGKDELIVVHPPSLYVLSYDGEAGWRLRFDAGHEEAPVSSGLRSIAVATGDLDRDGIPDFVAAHADERLYWYEANREAHPAGGVAWVEAFALNDAAVQLAWVAPGVDSVTIYRGPLNGPLDPWLSTTGTSYVDSTTVVQRYALRSWSGGVASSLSQVRTVRPHPQASIASVAVQDEQTVEIVFSERLDPALLPSQFFIDGDVHPVSVLPSRGGFGVLLRFERPPAGTVTVAWENLRDVEGTPVGVTSVAVTFEARERRDLIVTSWEVVDAHTVVLVFSEPLDPSSALDLEHYELRPSGAVVDASIDAAAPERVTLAISGQVIGATGLETTIVLRNLVGVSGARLVEGGQAVRLTQAAADLASVYVFPNPCEVDRHGNRIMIAGLTPEATVRVLSATGVLVTVLEERDGDGGVVWDLTDQGGRLVPSGVYLIRVETDGQPPVLHKAAVIR